MKIIRAGVHKIFEHVQNFCTDLWKLHTWEEYCSNWIVIVIVNARMD